MIPESISAEELDAVAGVLKRKPIIWDNYFANDGPKHCKFLKLKPLEGRNQNVLKHSSGWALNLMNQPHLSEIVFASSVDVLRKNAPPNKSFHDAAQRLAGEEFVHALRAFGNIFVTLGLDRLELDSKQQISQYSMRAGFRRILLIGSMGSI